MTYVKMLNTDADDDRWIEAGSHAFALYFGAMVWSNRHLTDGYVPRKMLTHVALATPKRQVAVAEAALTRLGFWTKAEPDGYLIVDFHEHALSRSTVEKTRDKWRADKERQRQHRVGEHSMCLPEHCAAAKASTAESEVVSGVESSVESSVGSHDKNRPEQTRPDQTPAGSGSGMRGGDPENDAGASLDATPRDDELPVHPYVPVGDCPHMSGGRDTSRLSPDRIRCKPCRLLADAQFPREGLEQVRAELDRQLGDSWMTLETKENP